MIDTHSKFEPVPPQDPIQRKLDQIIGSLLFNLTTELSEDVLRMTGQLSSSEKITDFTAEQIKEKIVGAAEKVADRQNSALREQIADLLPDDQ